MYLIWRKNSKSPASLQCCLSYFDKKENTKITASFYKLTNHIILEKKRQIANKQTRLDDQKIRENQKFVFREKHVVFSSLELKTSELKSKLSGSKRHDQDLIGFCLEISSRARTKFYRIKFLGYCMDTITIHAFKTH